jgi:hypothetical protein
VEISTTGNSTTLVVRLQLNEDGIWHVHVEGPQAAQTIHLTPATLIVQLWRAGDANLLRANIRLHGSKHYASIQSNSQLNRSGA